MRVVRTFHDARRLIRGFIWVDCKVIAAGKFEHNFEHKLGTENWKVNENWTWNTTWTMLWSEIKSLTAPEPCDVKRVSSMCLRPLSTLSGAAWTIDFSFPLFRVSKDVNLIYLSVLPERFPFYRHANSKIFREVPLLPSQTVKLSKCRDCQTATMQVNIGFYCVDLSACLLDLFELV